MINVVNIDGLITIGLPPAHSDVSDALGRTYMHQLAVTAEVVGSCIEVITLLCHD